MLQLVYALTTVGWPKTVLIPLPIAPSERVPRMSLEAKDLGIKMARRLSRGD